MQLFLVQEWGLLLNNNSSAIFPFCRIYRKFYFPPCKQLFQYFSFISPNLNPFAINPNVQLLKQTCPISRLIN